MPNHPTKLPPAGSPSETFGDLNRRRMKTLPVIVAVCVIWAMAGCGRNEVNSQAKPRPSRISITERSATGCSFEFAISEQECLSLWIGQPDHISHLYTPPGSGAGTFAVATTGLVWRVGGATVGPIPYKGFAFQDGPTVTEPDGSVVIGTCSEGKVAIRISKVPKQILEAHHVQQ